MPKGVPRDPDAMTARRGEANPRGSIKAASTSFREMLNDGGLRPSVFLLQRMRDHPDYRDEGDPECAHEFSRADGKCKLCEAEKRVPMKERICIADKLVAFELPRLAAIEAEINTTDKSHEDWVREFASTEPDQEHTIQ